MIVWLAPHLSFLIQWLRILGVNVQLWHKKVYLRPEKDIVVEWAKYPLPLKGLPIRRLTLKADSKETLLREFFYLMRYQPKREQLFQRCLRCNSTLISLTPEEAKSKWPDLPVYVFQTQVRFNWCESCKQLFWAGTHVQNMIRTLKDWGILPDSESSINDKNCS